MGPPWGNGLAESGGSSVTYAPCPRDSCVRKEEISEIPQGVSGHSAQSDRPIGPIGSEGHDHVPGFLSRDGPGRIVTSYDAQPVRPAVDGGGPGLVLPSPPGQPPGDAG